VHSLVQSSAKSTIQMATFYIPLKNSRVQATKSFWLLVKI
jgi:hypothetical protein